MLDDVVGDPVETIFSANNCLETSPARLSLAGGLFLDLFCDLVRQLIDRFVVGFGESDLRQARLVEDPNGRAVLYGASEVVDVDVVAEDRTRRLVGRFD